MLFKFLKYVSPVWYFNLTPEKDYGYFPSKQLLHEYGISYEPDQTFLTSEAQEREFAYALFQKGFIIRDSNHQEQSFKSVDLPIADEYRFIRKYFSQAWVLYIFLIRILSLRNPVVEIQEYVKSKDSKRVRLHKEPVSYPDYESFVSPLIQSKPFISIIIPTLNRYKYLKDVFQDLSNQTYKHFEVIVVDQTDPFQEEIYKGWNFELKYWYQKEKALWKARNDAIKSSNGTFILLYDDDSLIEQDWIEQHLKALDFFDADLSSGVSISKVGAKVPEHYSHFRWSDQLDTGNVLIKKSVFDEIGLFDTKFEKQRMGDGEYGLRAFLAGFRNVSNPFAKRLHLKVGQGGLRQMGSWDGWRPKKFFGPRPVPSILYLFRKYFGTKLTLWALLKGVPPSIIPYKFKSNKALQIIGLLISVLILPIVLIQVRISWRMSSEMLKD